MRTIEATYYFKHAAVCQCDSCRLRRAKAFCPDFKSTPFYKDVIDCCFCENFDYENEICLIPEHEKDVRYKMKIRLMQAKARVSPSQTKLLEKEPTK